MKKLVSLLVFILIGTAVQVNAQNLACKKFKEGTFKLVGGGKTYIIIRKGNIQSEYIENDKKRTMVFDLKWLDDCSYTLIPTAATKKAFPDIPETWILTTKITKTTDSSYSFSSTMNTAEGEITGEITKVKE